MNWYYEIGVYFLDNFIAFCDKTAGFVSKGSGGCHLPSTLGKFSTMSEKKKILYPSQDFIVWMHAQLHGLQQVG